MGLLEFQERIFPLTHFPELIDQASFVLCKPLGSRTHHRPLSGRDDEGEGHLHVICPSDYIFLALIQEQAFCIRFEADLLFALLISCIIMQGYTDRCTDHADSVAQIACFNIVIRVLSNIASNPIIDLCAACGYGDKPCIVHVLVSVEQGPCAL